MSATVSVRPERAARVARFDTTERVVHWCNATLFLTMIAHRRGVVRGSGLASSSAAANWCARSTCTPASCSRCRSSSASRCVPDGQLRDDLGRLSRWDRDDRIWWRKAKRASAQLGKFNPGQKLNATFLGAAIVVMLATGSIMRWFEPFPIDWRTGATFVHDWFALGVGLAVFGHILLAVSDPDALRGIVRGWVPRALGEGEAPALVRRSRARESAEAADSGGAVGDVVTGAE